MLGNHKNMVCHILTFYFKVKDINVGFTKGGIHKAERAKQDLL